MSALPDADRFPTTSWSAIAQAAGAGDAAGPALAALCQQYWYPLYAFARRCGVNAWEAEDLTQGFFVHFLDRAVYARADPARGRFRTFLLRCFRNYQANERRAARRGPSVVSFTTAEAESRYQQEPSDLVDPERLFTRRWALTLIATTLEALRAEYDATGRAVLFDRLSGSLLGESSGTFPMIAMELGMSAEAVRQAATRLRARFGAALRAHIRGLVEDAADVDDELQHLIAAVAA
jgi:RNA polymerase sigma-70 factor (ECF subfamily)